MNKQTYDLLENFMLCCMKDAAHDKEHVYRVLYHALEIAKTESPVNYDILIAACLLHDIGRKEQFENPALCHARVGSEKAYQFLLAHGFDVSFAEPLYSLLPDGSVSTGEHDITPSFFQEYKYKLENLYSGFYTEKAAAIAKERQSIAAAFYDSLYQEVNSAYQNGRVELEHLLVIKGDLSS